MTREKKKDSSLTDEEVVAATQFAATLVAAGPDIFSTLQIFAALGRARDFQFDILN